MTFADENLNGTAPAQPEEPKGAQAPAPETPKADEAPAATAAVKEPSPPATPEPKVEPEVKAEQADKAEKPYKVFKTKEEFTAELKGKVANKIDEVAQKDVRIGELESFVKQREWQAANLPSKQFEVYRDRIVLNKDGTTNIAELKEQFGIFAGTPAALSPTPAVKANVTETADYVAPKNPGTNRSAPRWLK